jgi:UDP-N-acetyl-D-glucosamine dehydrogenase
MNSPVVQTSLFSQLEVKIDRREAKIGVIGLGYVGLPLSLLYAGQGFPVTGFDIDQLKVDALTQGKSYIYRIPAEEIQEAGAKGFKATSEFRRLAEMDVIIICVPTPLNEHREPDTSFIINTAHAVVPYLQAGQLVVLESTTYPGTTEELLVPILESENRQALRAARRDVESISGGEFYVAFSPEREDPGNTEDSGRNGSASSKACGESLRSNIQPCCAGFFASGGGNDQVAREHLPLREYCSG